MRRRRPARLLPLALAVAAGVFTGTRARPAAATLATAQLESTNAVGAADCPDASHLARMVNDGLGRAALAPAATDAPEAPLRVGVTFERAGRGYAATVRLGGARDGTRKLSNGGPGCTALANAVSVLLVVLLDSEAEAPGAADGRPDRSAGPSSAPPRDAAYTGPNAELGFGGGVAEGLVGGWSPTLGLGGTLAYRHWAARLGGMWLPSKTSDNFPGRIDVSLAVARLALCATTGDDRSRVRLGICVQQQIGWMQGHGFLFGAGRVDSDRLWLALGPALVASGAFQRSFGWEVEAGAVHLLQQQRFASAFGTAYEADSFAFMTTLSFTTRVW